MKIEIRNLHMFENNLFLLNVRNRMLFCRANENLNISGNTMKMITNTRMQILHVVKQILQREKRKKRNNQRSGYIICSKHEARTSVEWAFFASQNRAS